MKLLSAVLLGLLVWSFSGCYYDVEEELYLNNNACDTANITFKTTINTLLTQNCTTCHNTGNPQGGINLEGFDNVQPHVSSGKLLSSIKHDGKASRMPKDKPKLSSCDILKVQIWIDKGAVNN